MALLIVFMNSFLSLIIMIAYLPLSFRHSRFGGTFVIKDVKSISDNDMIFHKPLTKAVKLAFDFEKVRGNFIFVICLLSL